MKANNAEFIVELIKQKQKTSRNIVGIVLKKQIWLTKTEATAQKNVNRHIFKI